MLKRLPLFLGNLCSTTAAFVSCFVFMNFPIVSNLKLFMALFSGYVIYMLM